LVIYYENNGSDGSYHQAKYDDKGNTIEEILENEKSNGRQYIKYTNQYNDKNILVKVEKYRNKNYDGKTDNLIENDNIVESKYYDSKNQLSGIVKYLYDEKRHLVNTTYYDKNNKQTYSEYQKYQGDFLVEHGEIMPDYERHWTYEKK